MKSCTPVQRIRIIQEPLRWLEHGVEIRCLGGVFPLSLRQTYATKYNIWLASTTLIAFDAKYVSLENLPSNRMEELNNSDSFTAAYNAWWTLAGRKEYQIVGITNNNKQGHIKVQKILLEEHLLFDYDLGELIIATLRSNMSKNRLGELLVKKTL